MFKQNQLVENVMDFSQMASYWDFESMRCFFLCKAVNRGLDMLYSSESGGRTNRNENVT